MEDLTGKQLGPYRVVAPLGEGGMAAVYKAYQPAMDRYVALKILPRSFADDPQFVGRFQQEAKVIAKLQHIHILAVHDYGEADGYTYIVMPFMESGTLTGLLRGQPLPIKQIASIVSQVGDALDYAHSRGIVHRDVKPSNVLIDERGNCLLTDFGIAKMVEGTAKFTVTGGIIGTPAYMSPEQGLGQKVDARSDIYALGVMLYEMATGRVPFQAETPMAIVIKHINDPLPLPRNINPALPEAFERVILKALAKNPDDRYQTTGELGRAVSEVVEGREQKAEAAAIERPAQPVAPTVVEASPVTTLPTPAPRPARARSRVVAAIIGLIVVALIAVGGGVIAISRLGSRATEAPGVLPVTATQPAVTVSVSTPSTTQLSTRMGTAPPAPTTVTPGVSIRVFAYAQWYDTQVIITAGQRVIISASGNAYTSPKERWGPDGSGVPQSLCAGELPVPEADCGTLVARLVGSKFYVGSHGEFVASKSGKLYLAVNVRNPNITHGAFDVTIIVQ